MDEMTQYEIYDIIQNLKYIDKEYRTLTRYQIYIGAKPYADKGLEIEDILSLPWDLPENTGVEEDEDTIKAKNQYAKQIEKMLNEGKFKFEEATNFNRM